MTPEFDSAMRKLIAGSLIDPAIVSGAFVTLRREECAALLEEIEHLRVLIQEGLDAGKQALQ